MFVGASLLVDGAHDKRARPSPGGSATSRLRSVPAPRLSDAQINRQDPPEPRRQRREARAHDQRPLLTVLPTTLQGVTFDIGGLADDDRTTIVVADARGLGSQRAQIAWRTLLRRTGDRSLSYRLEIKP